MRVLHQFVNTKKYRTRHEFHERIQPKGNHYIIGLDAGYSSMKVFHETGYFCIPSFVKRITENQLTIQSPEDLLYRDGNGELYLIGKTAQNLVSSTDTNDTESELFSRKRYSSHAFQILCNVSLALAMQKKKDNRSPVVQTGLPPAYLEADSQAMRKALCGTREFELKVGLEPWKLCRLDFRPDQIYLMPQPAGSLYSALIRSNGEYAPDARDLLYSNSLVLDIGFGTFDFYGLKSRAIVCRESIDDIGMREVLKETSGRILDDLQEDIRVPALQKCLERGTVEYVNEEQMEAGEKDLSPYLEQASGDVFKKAMEKARNVTNSFREYKYLIVGGGTGEAWYAKICDYLKGMKTLQIFPSNRNDPTLPFLYSNVRGYYLYRYSMDKNNKR